ALCVQVLKRQNTKTINQLPAFLMSKVRTPICDPLMDPTDNFSALCPRRRAFLGFGELALRLRQLVLFGAKKARIGYLLTSRQRSERFETDIHANSAAVWCKRLWLSHNAETDKPLASSRTPQRNRLNLPFDRTMQDDLDRPDLAQGERVAGEERTVAIL